MKHPKFLNNNNNKNKEETIWLLNFYGSLSLNKNELQHFAIHNLSTAPSNPSTGQVYFNTSTSKPMMYDGSVWVDLTATGTIRDLVLMLQVVSFLQQVQVQRARF